MINLAMPIGILMAVGLPLIGLAVCCCKARRHRQGGSYRGDTVLYNESWPGTLDYVSTKQAPKHQWV